MRTFALVALAGLIALFGLAGCATTSQAVRKPDATLTLSAKGPCALPPGAQASPSLCPVAEARVYIDEQLIGHAGELSAHPLPVVAGPLRIEVRADGFFTAYRDLTVHPGESAHLDVELRRVPEGEPGG